MNYYPHHIGDYAKDTAHLSMLEDGAYRRLLDILYSTERPLPKEKEKVYRLARARSKEEKAAIDTVLDEFFSPVESGWMQDRALAEILKAQEKSSKAADSAAKRWHSEGNAKAMRTHSEGNARPESEGNAPNNQEPIANSQRVEQTRSQGSRLPSDWQPSEDLLAWAKEKRPDLDLSLTAERFSNFWHAKPGKDGRKLDWDKTFRNWVIGERSGPNGQSQKYDYSEIKV